MPSPVSISALASACLLMCAAFGAQQASGEHHGREQYQDLRGRGYHGISASSTCVCPPVPSNTQNPSIITVTETVVKGPRPSRGPSTVYITVTPLQSITTRTHYVTGNGTVQPSTVTVTDTQLPGGGGQTHVVTVTETKTRRLPPGGTTSDSAVTGGPASTKTPAPVSSLTRHYCHRGTCYNSLLPHSNSTTACSAGVLTISETVYNTVTLTR